MSPFSALKKDSLAHLSQGFRIGRWLGTWGVSQDRIKKGRPREGWDLPKAHSKGMAKWGLGPRDLPTQASVLILDLELPRVTAFFLQVPLKTHPAAGWGWSWALKTAQ